MDNGKKRSKKSNESNDGSRDNQTPEAQTLREPAARSTEVGEVYRGNSDVVTIRHIEGEHHIVSWINTQRQLCCNAMPNTMFVGCERADGSVMHSPDPVRYPGKHRTVYTSAIRPLGGDEITISQLLDQMKTIGPNVLRDVLRVYELLSDFRDRIGFYEHAMSEAAPYRETAQKAGWLDEYDENVGFTALQEVFTAFLPPVRGFVGRESEPTMELDECDAAIRSDILRGNIGQIIGTIPSTEIGNALEGLGSVLEHMQVGGVTMAGQVAA